MFNAHQKGDNPEKSERLIDWLLTPRELRQPNTLRALATELGVSEDTLRNWRKSPSFARSMQERARQLVKTESLPDIIDSLQTQATDPSNPRSVQAAKLLIDFMQSNTPGGKLDLSELSDDDVKRLAQAALEKLTEAQ